MKSYSSRQCRKILRTGFNTLKKKGGTLSESKRREFEAELHQLDAALLAGNKDEASSTAARLDPFIKTHFPKTAWDHFREIGYALVFAIVVAFLIRQFWFELYEVPTGSMRPTVGELDRMLVSKTTFGISVPFVKKPLFYSDEYVKRGGIIVFTVRDMDVPDADMLYFHLIPGKKRYIKRAVAKPGDTLYFYGGQIYSVDKEGKPVLTLADPAYLQQIGIEKIDHVPFINFDGKMKVSRRTAQNIFGAVTLKQMNLPVGKLEITENGKIEGKFFNGEEWVEDQVSALKTPHDQPMSYSDLWGIGNYAMARMLTLEEAKKFYNLRPQSDDVLAFLELAHTPNLSYPKPELRQDDMGRVHPMITPFTTLLPLKQSHLEGIQKALYTARFFVKDGHAYRYQEGRTRPQRPEYDPRFPNVPDGLYEFYYGVGYKLHFGGIRTKLPLNHPLYASTLDNIYKLFNVGIGFNRVFEPMAPLQPYSPQRFAYYREGDLYVMGEPIFKKNDPVLVKFVQNELEKQKSSNREAPYIAFVDHGPPLSSDGTLDTAFIEKFGLKVPEDGIVGLGDNYAMSSDSRDFGFVPIENLRGSPSFTFWPPGKRMGPLPQPGYSWWTFPNLLIWSLAILVFIVTYLWLRRRNRRSIFPK